MRIVFFGTPEFAVESAEAIFNAGFEMAAVVTMPDKMAGRGYKLTPSPVKQWAVAHNIPVLQPQNLKDSEFIDNLKSLDADLFVVIAFRMLPQVVWQMPPLGTFNLHASLLPQYRGAAPINWALINGEKETGVTTFFLKHEIDTGDILLQEKIAIEDNDNAGTLHDKLMQLGARLTVETLKMIDCGEASPIPQSSMDVEPKAAPKIFHETCYIDWNQSAERIRDFVRGLSPYPAARAVLQFPRTDKTEYKIFDVQPYAMEKLAPGEVSVDNKAGILVGCANGAIQIGELQGPGKKRMDAKAFINGLR